MTRCNECDAFYPHKSHCGICVNLFGKCVSCMIEAKELNETHLKEIYFLAGDNEPSKTLN